MPRLSEAFHGTSLNQTPLSLEGSPDAPPSPPSVAKRKGLQSGVYTIIPFSVQATNFPSLVLASSY